MNAQKDADDLLRQYLLGNLSADVRERVESQLFSDDKVFWERMSEAEDALIDDYLWDELGEQEKEQFERVFLMSSERCARLAFARALRVYANANRSEKPGVWQWLRKPVTAPAWSLAAAAALALLVLPSVVWQYGIVSRSPSEISASLSPSSIRLRSVGGNVARVVAPADCQLIRLELDPGSHQTDSYRATLYQVTGEEIWFQRKHATRTTDGRSRIQLTLPCEVLPEGDYFITLQALSPTADLSAPLRYDFRLLRGE